MEARDDGSALVQYIADIWDPALTWEAIGWLRSISPLPLVIKGILTAEDARRAVDHGAAGIVVSNHGGRQLDGTLSTRDALAEVADAVGDAVELLVDGGIRRGSDILKALALGARAVLIGRPYLWALAVGGQPGVEHMLGLLRDELDLDMALAGRPTIASIDRTLVHAVRDGLSLPLRAVVAKRAFASHPPRDYTEATRWPSIPPRHHPTGTFAMTKQVQPSSSVPENVGRRRGRRLDACRTGSPVPVHWRPRVRATTFRVGCIGTGDRWNGLYREILPDGDIVAVCDVDRKHAESGKEKAGGKADIYDDYRKLLDRKDIDVVTIVTPDHWHTKIAIDAMRAGKDVYCEKPLTLTIDEGKQICKVLKETGRVFQVGTQQRQRNGTSGS